MIKKTLSLLLSALLVLSLSVSAFAGGAPVDSPAGVSSDPALDKRLADVTLLVKDTLGIGDNYTNFYGNLNDKGIRQFWTLNWSNGDEYLTVMADEGGKIFNCSHSLNNYDYSYRYDFAPEFPSVTRDQAKAAAEAFLAKVLDKNESCDFINQSSILNPSDVDNYYFNGMLKVNGLETPIYVNINVSTRDLSVSYFNRGDMSTEYIGEIPTADPVTTSAKAAELLAGPVKMNLQYVLSDVAGADKNPSAVLRYLPVTTGNYVVNAKTGKLIDINELYHDVATGRGGDGYGGAAAYETADMASSKSTLTDVEREGISKLEGVFSSDKLDAKARAITEFGLLPEYTLNNVSYSLNHETGEVTAYISYTLKIKPDTKEDASLSQEKKNLIAAAGGEYVTFIYKTVTMDAKTGEFKSLSTSYPYDEDYKDIKKDSDALQKKAADFLTKYFKEYYDKTAAYESEDTVIPYYYSSGNYTPDEDFSYSQFVNGYFFPTNRINISVNAETGSIDNFNMSWTENVAFESADGIISNEKACANYAAAFDTKLSYVSLPVAVDPSRPDLARYAEYGYSYVYELILGYTSVSEKYITGVNAKTGDVISSDPYKEKGPNEYDDIAGLYAESQIKKLAQYGIGFPGKSFKPKQQLTQLDMVILLMSADGYRIDHENLTEDEIASLYSSAYYRNILKKEEKNPAKLMTRSDLIRTILTMSGYGKTADLKGIYICKFKDAASIKDADYGYFAIAQGLGIISGDSKGNANPNSYVTRAEAATMLYNFMSR